MTTDVLDPFADPGEILQARREEIITAGRYRLPDRHDNPKKGGWQRVTNLVGAYSDQYGLRVWEIAKVLEGVKNAPHLVRLIQSTPFEKMTKAQRREWVENFVERAKEVTDANDGAKFGNLRHAQAEAHEEGELPRAMPDAYARQHFSLYRSAMVRHRLRAVAGMQERRVLVEDLEAVGTLDNVLEDLASTLLGVGDLKTQKRFWTFLEISAQLACYANAVAMWEPSEAGGRAGRWVDMPKVRTDIAYVLWMPRQAVNPEEEPDWQPHVDVYEVDIEAGWRSAKLAHQIVKDRAAGKSKKKPRAWLRDAPPITDVERYAARFAAVETPAEGSALVAEAKRVGVWCEVLADEARAARERILAARG